MALTAAPKAHALDSGDIVIAGLKGEVHVTMKGAERAVRVGTVLELPATVRTGPDGAVDLKQGATAVSVGPDTLLEFPALETAGGPIDRIVQPRGNAFYSIGKRAGRKLRVETPYLVGVVKGTQFNVVAREEATTISLFEGSLEIHASDESSVVDIKAGEVATRDRNGKDIGVFKMDPGKAPQPRAPGARNGGAGSPMPGSTAPRGIPLPGDNGSARANDDLARTSLAVSVVAIADAPGAGAGAIGAATAAAVDVGAGAAVDVITNVTPNVTAAAIEAPVDADLGAVDLLAGANAVAGPAAVDTNVNVGMDPGGGAASVDVGMSTAANLGSAAAPDVGAGAAVDLGTSAGAAANVDVNAGARAGPLATDAGAGVAVDLGGGQGAANVDLGVNAGVGHVVAIETGGTVGADLGLDDDDDQGENKGTPTTPPPGNVVDDVVETVDSVLKGLLRKPGKK
jgi:hypothetical protein